MSDGIVSLVGYDERDRIIGILTADVARLTDERDAAVADNAILLEKLTSLKNELISEVGGCIVCDCTGFTDGENPEIHHCTDCVLLKPHPGQSLFDRLAKLEAERDECRDRQCHQLREVTKQRDAAIADNAFIISRVKLFMDYQTMTTLRDLRNVVAEEHPGQPLLDRIAKLEAENSAFVKRDEDALKALEATLENEPTIGAGDVSKCLPGWIDTFSKCFAEGNGIALKHSATAALLHTLIAARERAKRLVQERSEAQLEASSNSVVYTAAKCSYELVKADNIAILKMIKEWLDRTEAYITDFPVGLSKAVENYQKFCSSLTDAVAHQVVSENTTCPTEEKKQ